MKIDERQIKIIQDVWTVYDIDGVTFYNANQTTTPEEIDSQRNEIIPEIRGWLDNYLSGKVPLDEFKTAIDSINKSHPLWGFKGINGQMFFNMLYKTCLQFDDVGNFEQLLKKSLEAPSDIDAAKSILETFREFTETLSKYHVDRRAAPKIGSIPFFLSYFWQIQQPEKYPVYYSSMVNVLSDLDVWTPTKDIVADYSAFFQLNDEMISICGKIAGRDLNLWDIEHAFWYYNQKLQEHAIEDEPVAETRIKHPTEAKKLESLPESYIPSIVSILPKLAVHDEHLAAVCDKSGKNIITEFEERLAILFRMLGFEVEYLGQGRGRVPDGVAICPEYRYAVIYDAKVRKDGYTMGTDERAIREYIAREGDRLRKQGYRNIYFMIISSKFSGDHDSEIRNLKIDTDVREILMVEVTALLVLLEGKFRNPEITLGPDGVQNLLAASGLLTAAEVRAFLG